MLMNVLIAKVMSNIFVDLHFHVWNTRFDVLSKSIL